MEYWTRSLAALADNKEFTFHPKCRRSGIITLIFADDLLVFCKADMNSIKSVTKKLEFAQVSGLCANMEKTSIYFGGIDVQKQQDLSEVAGMVIGTLPFHYLGVPLSAKKLTFS